MRNIDIEQASSNLANVSGVLTGFTSTLIVLLLTPGTFSNALQTTQEIIVTLLLVTAGLYISAASVMSNVPRIRPKNRIFGYNFGLLSFLLGNVLFFFTLTKIFTAFSFDIATLTGYVITGVSALIFALNLFWIINSRRK